MKKTEQQVLFEVASMNALKLYLVEYRGTKFRAENVRIFAERRGIVLEASNRAWGSVMQRAKKLGLIVNAGYEPVLNPKAHGAIVSAWRAV